MRPKPLFPDACPFSCDVLVLCEGDAVGYETQLLKLWADAEDLEGAFVQVMPGGTSEALYGMADSVGRTVPIIVIEDRDFRTPDEARADSNSKKTDRQNRSVSV